MALRRLGEVPIPHVKRMLTRAFRNSENDTASERVIVIDSKAYLKSQSAYVSNQLGSEAATGVIHHDNPLLRCTGEPKMSRGHL